MRFLFIVFMFLFAKGGIYSLVVYKYKIFKHLFVLSVSGFDLFVW